MIVEVEQEGNTQGAGKRLRCGGIRDRGIERLVMVRHEVTTEASLFKKRPSVKESGKEGTEGGPVSISATSHLISVGISELLRTEEGHGVRGRVNRGLTGHLSPPLWLKHHEGIQFESAAHKEKEEVRVALRRALEFNPKVCDCT